MTLPQAQPDQILRVLSSQLGVSPQDLEERARQSRLSLAATMAALQDRCSCNACQLLRQTAGKLVQDALKEVTPPPPAAATQPIEAALAPPLKG